MCYFKKLITGISVVSVMLIQSVVFASTGVVDTDALNVRTGPNTDAQIVGQVYSGDNVDILGLENGFYKITYNGNQYYVASEYVKNAAPITSGWGMVTTDELNIRSGPATSNEVVGKLIQGDVIAVTAKDGDWYKVSFGDNTGYVFGEFLSVKRDMQTASRSKPSNSGGSVVEYAKKYIGVPYAYGGNSPSGFDCSGFTNYVYSHFGIDLSHSASSQAAAGVYVEKARLVPGDLVFFTYYGGGAIEHVGIYVGNGQFIHSTRPGSTVKITDLNSDYYAKNYVTARRVLR